MDIRKRLQLGDEMPQVSVHTPDTYAGCSQIENN